LPVKIIQIGDTNKMPLGTGAHINKLGVWVLGQMSPSLGGGHLQHGKNPATNGKIFNISQRIIDAKPQLIRAGGSSIEV
jgi:hypothetical protein